MNKLMGFYELRDSGLPAVPWKTFNEFTELSDDYLWTIRTAINKGNDLNLPRIVGARGTEAYNVALEIYHKYKDMGMIVYYPYFIAEKSGVIDVSKAKIVIEAVRNDLWNLVTDGIKDVSITIDSEGTSYIGDKKFLSIQEIELLNKQVKIIKKLYRDMLNEGKSVLVEWSFAFDTDINKNKIGEKYLVFYELRSI